MFFPDAFLMHLILQLSEINNLSFGYFFSNLVEFIHLRSRNQLLSDTMSNFLYPISEGKETYRLRDLEVRFDVPIPRE